MSTGVYESCLMKVAIVHDWLTGLRGGERCLEEFIRLYPEAKVYTLLHVPGATSNLIDSHVVQTSFLQKLPGVKNYYRWLLPFFPFAIRSLKVKNCDLVISLSHAAAKNVRVPAGAKHICFCFTPMRYIWDQMASYFGVLRFALYPIISLLRVWDQRGAAGVTKFVAISRFVAARIRLFYGRKAAIVYPPVGDYWLAEGSENTVTKKDFYLYAGALVPYKNVEEIIVAFNQLNLPLVIAGDGPLKEKLSDMANSNIEFLGRVSDEHLKALYSECKALLFAAKEDFGLIPIECLGQGSPVIAPYCGALKESLKNIKYWSEHAHLSVKSAKAANTGVFYRYDTKSLAEEIKRGVEFFEQKGLEFHPEDCKSHAGSFSVENFRVAWKEVVESSAS